MSILGPISLCKIWHTCYFGEPSKNLDAFTASNNKILNIQDNTVKTVRLEKLNGRRQYRQSATQRRANNRIT